MMRGIPFAKEILGSLSGSKEASLEIIEGEFFIPISVPLKILMQPSL